MDKDVFNKRLAMISICLQARRLGCSAASFFNSKFNCGNSKPTIFEICEPGVIELARLYVLDPHILVFAVDKGFPSGAIGGDLSDADWRARHGLERDERYFVLRRVGKDAWHVL